MPAPAKLKDFAKRFGTALGEGKGAAGMEYEPTTVSNLPRAELFQSQPGAALGDPQTVDRRRRTLAQIMAQTGKPGEKTWP